MNLNTDGSSTGNPEIAGCGGVVRDEHGRWVRGFARQIGLTTSFVAELWGLRDGLLMCYNLNIFSFIVELDTKSIVNALGNSEYVNNVISPILDDCRLQASRFHQIQFKHCFQPTNCCVDSLARMSTNQDLVFTSFESPPVDISLVFENDLSGMYSNRFCPEPIVTP